MKNSSEIIPFAAIDRSALSGVSGGRLMVPPGTGKAIGDFLGKHGGTIANTVMNGINTVGNIMKSGDDKKDDDKKASSNSSGKSTNSTSESKWRPGKKMRAPNV